MVVSIDKANYIKDYIIELHFSDGVEKRIDFKEFLEANNPMTKKFLDKALFQNFRIDYGDILWNDYEMCFPLWDFARRNDIITQTTS